MRFYAFSPELPVDINAAKLRAMPPHMRSQCFAMVLDIGLLSELDISAAFGISEHAVRQIAGARHAVKPAADVAFYQEKEEREPTSSPAVSLPRNALAFLRKIAAAPDGFRGGKTFLAKMLEISPRAADTAMERLIDERLVVRVEPGSGSRAPLYAATPEGKALAASILPLPKAGG